MTPIAQPPMPTPFEMQVANQLRTLWGHTPVFEEIAELKQIGVPIYYFDRPEGREKVDGDE